MKWENAFAAFAGGPETRGVLAVIATSALGSAMALMVAKIVVGFGGGRNRCLTWVSASAVAVALMAVVSELVRRNGRAVADPPDKETGSAK